MMKMRKDVHTDVCLANFKGRKHFGHLTAGVTIILTRPYTNGV
jgi:hypothetical protein